MEILKNIIPDIITKVWLTGVGAIIVSRVTWYTGAQGHGIQFAYTKFLLFFCLIFCLCQHQILLF